MIEHLVVKDKNIADTVVEMTNVKTRTQLFSKEHAEKVESTVCNPLVELRLRIISSWETCLHVLGRWSQVLN